MGRETSKLTFQARALALAIGLAALASVARAASAQTGADPAAAQRMFEAATGGFAEVAKDGRMGYPTYVLYTRPLRVDDGLCQVLSVNLGWGHEDDEAAKTLITTTSYFFPASAAGTCEGPVGHRIMQRADGRMEARLRYDFARKIIGAAKSAGRPPFQLAFHCDQGRPCRTDSEARALLARLEAGDLIGGSPLATGPGPEDLVFQVENEFGDLVAKVFRDNNGTIVRVELHIAGRIRF